MHKKLFLTISIAFLLFWNSCKKPDPIDTPPPGVNPTNEILLFESYQMMESARERFIQIGDSMDIAPPEALYYTSLWAQNQVGVDDAFSLDSAHLIIQMTSGYESTLSLHEIGLDGLNVYRGGGSGTGTGKLSEFTGSSCSNEIVNKKVLLYAAYEHKFYAANEFQTRVVDKIENSDVDVEVFVLKNQECTVDAMLTFDEYGLVILDTHGDISGILTGITFTLDSADIPNSVDEYLAMIGEKIGPQHIPSVINANIEVSYAFEYDPQLQIQEQWDKYKSKLGIRYSVELTSKGVRELMPDLSGTIVFANACYSGWTATEWTIGNGTHTRKHPDPIKPAWMTKNPLTFYGYEAANDGVSYKAPNDKFCKPNEDTLIQSLFYDEDSTGNAHLADGSGSALVLEFPWNNDIAGNNNHGPLQFRQYASPQWCYGSCGDTLLDMRDMEVYQIVCIGEQVWMAENLRYNAPGSAIANNDPSLLPTYGRYYDYPTVSAGQGMSPGNQPSTIHGICPDGWHIPNAYEWEQMKAAIGFPNNNELAVRLKSPDDWDQDPDINHPFRNATGFNALPSDMAYKTISNGDVDYFPSYSNFLMWLSSPPSCFIADWTGALSMLSAPGPVGEGCVPADPEDADTEAEMYSCRCVKD
jgi:uncharacterized protein (TIGR02145 family)